MHAIESNQCAFLRPAPQLSLSAARVAKAELALVKEIADCEEVEAISSLAIGLVL